MLKFDHSSWVTIYPEIIVLVMVCLIALIDLFVKSSKRTLTYILTLCTLISVAFLTAIYAQTGSIIVGFGGMTVSDPISNWIKCFSAIGVAISLVYGRIYSFERKMLVGGEFFLLALFSLLGMFVMASAAHFLSVYMGLELLTLSSYAMVALRRENVLSSEAAMKYFVLGALASGFLLYGLSMIYGATGSLDIVTVLYAITTSNIQHQVLVFGLVFIVAGLGFKFGVVPFHMWVPDIYQGAPTSVALMVGAVPKLVAFALVIRLLVQGLLPLAMDWQLMLMLMAVASLVIGNLAAIAQTNLKRMLAYSTISQMGFVLIGLLSGVVDKNTFSATNAYASSMFYVVTYLLTTLAAFGVILLLSRTDFEAESINDFKGLSQRNLPLAVIMSICMFSLAGLPPFVGFYAKFAVLQALMSSMQFFGIVLSVVAVLMSLIGAFYYLRIVKIMFIDTPIDACDVPSIDKPTFSDLKYGVNTIKHPYFLIFLNGLLVLLLGIFPDGLFDLCFDAIVKTLPNLNGVIAQSSL